MNLHVLMALELDEEALVAHRDNLLEAGEVLYTEELVGNTRVEVRHWPGEPHEWNSMLDLRDLIDLGIILRTELLAVTAKPLDDEVGSRRGRLDRWTAAGLVVGLVIVAIIAALFTDDLVSVLQ